MPKSIVKRANEILKQLESDNRQQGIAGKPLAEVSENRGGMQLSFFQLDDPILCQIRDEILNLDVNNLTPIEALNKLNDIKKIVRGNSGLLTCLQIVYRTFSEVWKTICKYKRRFL